MIFLHGFTLFVVDIHQIRLISLFLTPFDHFHFYGSAGLVLKLILTPYRKNACNLERWRAFSYVFVHICRIYVCVLKTMQNTLLNHNKFTFIYKQGSLLSGLLIQETLSCNASINCCQGSSRFSLFLPPLKIIFDLSSNVIFILSEISQSFLKLPMIPQL